MTDGLSERQAIKTIAQNLGLRSMTDPVRAVVEYCMELTGRFIADYGVCETSDDMLQVCAQKTGTRFEVVECIGDLDRIMRTWVKRGEYQFATIEREFERGVLGVTFRIQQPAPWETPFVSVIDARGQRLARAWFTKWHELGHLLILHESARSSFCRSHSIDAMRDPEEALVDRIAGVCGFHPIMVRRFADAPLTFEKLEKIRKRMFPDASIQASRLGIVDAWPTPCLLLECRMSGRQRTGNGYALRAVRVSVNEAARKEGLTIFSNMRVPEASVITRAFQTRDCRTEIEDLSWWTSSGRKLANRRVRVSAGLGVGGIVWGLITEAGTL